MLALYIAEWQYPKTLTGSMEKLTGFLAYIRENHLEEAAKESLRVSREMNFPLMQLFAHIPDETLLPASMKSIAEFADSLADGSFMEKQLENLQKWEDDKLEGISKDMIQPTDLVMVYAAQKKSLHKFIPLYTSDPNEIIGIVGEMEELHSSIQDIGINMLFKWRKQTEKNLQETNQFLDAVLENIPNMIFIKDPQELRFIRLNKAGEELTGYANEDMLGKNDYDFFPKEQADFFCKKDEDVIASGKLVDIPQEPIETRFKGQRWLHTKKIPVQDENGKVRFLLGISEDITEQKKQEDLNLQLNKELEAFTYTVSHDLRAPLRAISGYANMLDEDYKKKLDEEGVRLLNVIRYNAEKMGSLIDDLLAFSKLGRKDLDKMLENMNELVDGVLNELNKSISHHAKIKVRKLHPAKVDYGLMHQVILNLVSNAIKYSSKKESPVIEISSEQKEGEIIYAVKDNGVGFNMKYVDKLFGVFQRLHQTDEFEGTGVGLAIVQRIVSKHNGRVWAEGKVNHGATFYFSLPAD
ncbi:MAG TPA: ATP-binding protein [Bacteroidia bacterium]|nr:ATP-binding protein [Bacteroidia bacterium]